MASFVKVIGPELNKLTGRQIKVLIAYRALSWRIPAGARKIARRTGLDVADVQKALRSLRCNGLVPPYRGEGETTLRGEGETTLRGEGETTLRGEGETTLHPGGRNNPTPTQYQARSRDPSVDLKTRSSVDPPSQAQGLPKSGSSHVQQNSNVLERTDDVILSVEVIRAFRSAFGDVSAKQTAKLLTQASRDCVAEHVNPPSDLEWISFVQYAVNEPTLAKTQYRLGASLTRLVGWLERERQRVKVTAGKVSKRQKDTTRQDEQVLKGSAMGEAVARLMATLTPRSRLPVGGGAGVPHTTPPSPGS